MDLSCFKGYTRTGCAGQPSCCKCRKSMPIIWYLIKMKSSFGKCNKIGVCVVILIYF